MAQLVIAKNLFDLHTLISKHIVEVAQRKLGYPFCIKMPGRLVVFICNLDLLKKMFLILPFGNMKCYLVDGSGKGSLLLLLCMVHIEVIDYKQTAFSQTLGNGSDGIIMLSPGAEIPETGKEIKCVLEIVDPEKLAHVVLVKMQLFRFLKPCFGNRSAGQVDTGYIKAHFGQSNAVPTLSTSHIQHQAALFGLQITDQGFYESAGLLLIPVLIQEVVVRRIEPVFIPGFVGHI